MHGLKSTPYGTCSFFKTSANGIVRIFGVLITKRADIFFMHHSNKDRYKTVFVIRNQVGRIAIGT